LVNNKRKPPKDGSLRQLFGIKVIILANAINEDSRKLDKLFIREIIKRGWLKALCYKDILIIIVCNLNIGQATLAIALKFIFYKGYNNKPKLYVSYPRFTSYYLYLYILGQYFS
jgi:hypothetical protein